jgi:hypothetical protein
LEETDMPRKKKSWWTWERFKDLMQIITPFLVLLATKWIKVR